MKKNYKNHITIVILILFFSLLLINSNETITELKNNTDLFFNTCFFSTFIFLLISNLLLENNLISYINYLFRNNSYYRYVLILSLMSGFPSGSIVIKDLLDNKIINEKIAKKMILYSQFPNPIFILYNLSLILKSNYLTILVLISILGSNLIIYIFTNKKEQIESTNTNNNIDFSISLQNSIIKTFKVIVLIYGISMFFELIIFFLCRIFTNKYIYILINGIFDLIKGIKTSVLINNKILRSYFIILLISFTPLSIHLQTKSILNNYYKDYIKGRIISLLLSFLIFTFLMFLHKHL